MSSRSLMDIEGDFGISMGAACGIVEMIRDQAEGMDTPGIEKVVVAADGVLKLLEGAQDVYSELWSRCNEAEDAG